MTFVLQSSMTPELKELKEFKMMTTWIRMNHMGNLRIRWISQWNSSCKFP